eukprot:symbB.v1.2.017750.t1/scaffold1390.1/size121990/7
MVLPLLLLLTNHATSLVSDEDSDRCGEEIETKMGKLTEEQNNGDIKAFLKGYDRNADGQLQEEEIKEAMKAAGISDGCLLASEVINHMDKNRDKMLHYDEL